MEIRLAPFQWAYDSKGYVLSEDGASLVRAGGELVEYDPVTRYEPDGASYGMWREGELPLGVKRRRERLGEPGRYTGEVPPLLHQLAPGGRFDWHPGHAPTDRPATPRDGIDPAPEALALLGPNPSAEQIEAAGWDASMRGPRDVALAVVNELGPLGYAGQQPDAMSEPIDWLVRELSELRETLQHIDFATRLGADGKPAPFEYGDAGQSALNEALLKRRFRIEAAAVGVAVLRPRTLLEYLWAQLLLDVTAGVGFHRCEFSRCQRPIPARSGDGRVGGLRFCSVAHRVAHGREQAKGGAAVVVKT